MGFMADHFVQIDKSNIFSSWLTIL